jgi:Curli production assembly/transport component CsgG
MNLPRTILLVVLTLCAVAEEPRVVAITPLELVAIDGVRSDGAATIAGVMEDQLQAQLSENERVTLVERLRIDQVLKEQSLAVSGLVDPATAARLGQLLKADVVVVGRIRVLADKRRMVTLRAVAVADAQVLWSGDAQGDDGALAGQSASLGAALATSLQGGTTTPIPVGATPLRAAKHHERALALRAVGASEEALAEEILALRHDPTFADAEIGFLTALSAAGFDSLAAAEAKAAIERTTAPVDSPLHAFAARSGLPTATRIEVQDSPTTSGLRRFVQEVGRRVRDAPPEHRLAARQDEIQAWILLGDVYVAERRDRRAGEAYQEALTRLWELRAQEPSMIQSSLGGGFSMPRICDTAAERAIEFAAGSQLQVTPNVRDALAKGQGLPVGCAEPLRTYHAELPVLARVLVPNPTRGAGNLLLRVGRGDLPAGGVIIHAGLSGPGVSSADPSSVRVVDTAWVPEEVTPYFARTGVAWPALSVMAYDQVLGRTAFVNHGAGPNTLIGVLQECLQRGERDRGFVIVDFQDRLTADQLKELRIHTEVVFPPKTSPGGLIPTGTSRIQTAVYLLLAGKRVAARDELVAASGQTLTRQDRNSQYLAQGLLALIPETP